MTQLLTRLIAFLIVAASYLREPDRVLCDGGEQPTAWQARDEALWDEAIRKAGSL